RALADAKVAEDLKLTDDQKSKIKTVLDDLDKESRSLFQPGGDRDEMRKKMTELRKTSLEKATAILTDEQKSKWKEMTGAPFTGELKTNFGPAGGVGRRGRQQPRENSGTTPKET